MTITDQEVEDKHAKMTAPGTFYGRNGGSFKHQNHMTKEEELEYVRTILEESKNGK